MPNVIISGLTASGKTTHSHILSGEFNLQYVSSSQILLSLLNFKSVQKRDFWISNHIHSIWESPEAKYVDDELLEIEKNGMNVVFDTIAMPWIHRKLDSLCIWLESSLESRVLKSIISHKGSNNYSHKEITDRIIKKDENAFSYLMKRYNVDISTDRSPFDLIIDTSQCTQETNFLKAFISIQKVHAVVRSAVGLYLTQSPLFAQDFDKACRKADSIKISMSPKFENFLINYS